MLTVGVVRSWAEEVLRQLEVSPGPALEVTDSSVGTHAEQAPPEPDGPYRSSLRLDAGTQDGPGPEWEVAAGAVEVRCKHEDGSVTLVTLDVSSRAPEAVVLLAEQLQDGVVESSGGRPLPPCPGHGHPAVPRVVEGVASWVCPDTGLGWPVLPSAGGAG
ncbi:hypothetical protein ACFV3R_06970 [Streptomyces sp. NPDC059740]|uniref:hypothetical protein n=1 Tax=Streptomyces sp. NPDC059740 TaxID=3346926 RepID=UPI0036693C0F